METSANILEQTLLKSYDPEAVAKLLKKKPAGECMKTNSKKARIEGKHKIPENLQFKVETLKAELKTEKNYRAHYESKARKAINHIRKLEEYVKYMKTQQSKHFEALKSKLFIRIGDIEKDTFEVKDAVISEMKNIADIRKPLENAFKVVTFLKSELEDRDKTIEEFKILLSEKDNKIDCFASGFSRSRELEEINDIIKYSKALNSELVDIKKYCEDKDSTITELEVEQKELTKEVENLKLENNNLEKRKNKLEEKRDVLKNQMSEIERKLKKRKSKIKTLKSDINNSRYEFESLNDLNENIEQQVSVLKEENKLLKERIAHKDADLSLCRSILKLSEEKKTGGLSRSQNNLQGETISQNLRNLSKESPNLKLIEEMKMKLNTSVETRKVEHQKEVQKCKQRNHSNSNTKILK